MRQTQNPAADAAGWTRQKERGNALGLWFMVLVALGLGRHVARFFVAFAVAWYVLRAWPVRRHVYAFLRRVLMRAPRFRDLIRTYWYFGTVTLDRVFFATGREGKFNLRVHNAGIVDQLQAQGRGAIFLGSHLGSFVALQAVGAHVRDLPIKNLQYPDQNPAISRVFARLAPKMAERMIPLGRSNVLVQLQACVREGGFAALLADRMAETDTRGVACEFLGGSVDFPSGGVEAAVLLDCPVVLFFSLYRGGNRYEFYFEHLEIGACAGRGERRAVVEAAVQRYAERLAHYARSAPYNWFNFYDYWHRAERAAHCDSRARTSIRA